MARWDKFLTGLSQGYGVGYERGEQYQEGNKKRALEAANKEIGGVLGGETTTEAAIPAEQVNIPEVSFQGKGMDETGRRQFDIDVGDIASTPERPVKLQGKVTGPQTRSQFDQLKQGLRKKYELEGNTQGLMNLDTQINEYRQGRILENLDAAAGLIGRDPEAAAQMLHNAYGYYPDGRQAMFTMKNGELYGYGFDEETNKFTSAMKIDADSIAALAEQLKDPQAFKQRIAAENLAAAQEAYARQQDALKMELEQRKVTATERGVAVDEDRAEYQNLGDWAKAMKDYYDIDATGMNAGSGGKKFTHTQMKDLYAAINGANAYFDKSIKDGLLSPAERLVIGSDEGTMGVDYRAIQGAMADILTNNMASGDSRLMSDADTLRAAVDAKMMEAFTKQQAAGVDADSDEAMKEIYDDLMERQRGVTLGPNGTLDMEIDGQIVHLTPTKYPALYWDALTQAGKDPRQYGVDPIAAGVPAPPGAQGTPSAVDTGEIQYGTPGYGLGDLAGDVGSHITQRLATQQGAGIQQALKEVLAANQKGQPVNQRYLQMLRDASPQELRQMGAPDDLIAAVFPSAPPSSAVAGAPTAAIPGV